MKISIICPIYNGEKYIKSLDNSIKLQKNVEIESIKYVLTESNDKSEDILKKVNAYYIKIKPTEFSHSLTRESEAFNSKGDIIVFISQDVIIKDNNWLYNLTKHIMDGSCEAAFSRQICENNSIEKYIRNKNYPAESRVVSKDDLEGLGLITFFFSDVSSAIRKDVFIKLNGYDNKDLIISEDMYIAYKLIMNGYRIRYCADSVVIHSHRFTCRQLFNRYFDTGVFFADNNYLNKYKANSSGFALAKYVLKSSIKDKNMKVLFNILPNFASRYIGMQMGKKYKNLNNKKIMKYTMNINYWNNK